MTNKKTISQQALDSIQKYSLRPIPKWQFLGKNILFWALSSISIVIFGLSLAMIIFMIQNPEYTPYLWVVLLLIFVGLSYLFFKNTKKSYRFNPLLIIVTIAIIGLISGFLFYRFNTPSAADQYLASHLSMYRQMAPLKIENWVNPQSGLLAGSITRVVSSSQFILTDFNQHSWTVNLTSDTLIRGRVAISPGSDIKLIGRQTGNMEFTVSEIRPWVGMMGGRMMMEN